MSFTLLVNATDLHSKSDLLATRYRLPHLLRRLIQRSDPTASQVFFRTEEGTQLGDWDGLIGQAVGNDYVPAGASAWELGVDKTPRKKADYEYEQRTANSLGIDKLQTTFVFVTSRRWGAKRKWVSEKQARKEWKEVRAYDAEDLATWLETAPGVHIWLSNELGKYPGGVTDLQTWWDDWAALTSPTMTGNLLLAGRTQTVEQISDWLRGADETFALQAGTQSEAVAVLAATVLKLPDSEQFKYLNRIVVVQNEAAWQELIAREEGLILVPEFESANVLGAATRRRHRVLLPLDAASIPTMDVVSLVPNQVQAMREALEQLGIQNPETDELAHLARRSFAAFRRKWLKNLAANAPTWAVPTQGKNLLPALLLGTWEDENPGDQAIVAQLAGQDYESYRQELLAWMHAPEAPVREVAGTWFVLDKADAWEQLSRLLSPALFSRYEAMALAVLGTPDPKFTLPDDEQRWARTRGMERAHSARLRGGIADTMALLGANGAVARIGSQILVSDGINRLLASLLEKANADELGHVWASFGRDVRALAEAAPDVFLKYVLEDLEQETPVLLTLFQEKEGLFYSSSEHSGLLWALEGLAWNPDYLFDAALALARLAHRDPGGQLANRPANSLRQIFLLWLPQTTANLETRLSVLERLREEEPTVLWGLLVRLLPQPHDVGHPSAMPQWRWRDWQVKQPSGITNYEWFEGIAAITKLVLAEAGTEANRWAMLFPELGTWLGHVSPENVEAILSQAEELGASQLPDNELVILRRELGKLLALHRSVDADWVLPTAILDRLGALYDKLAPQDLVLRYAWVFTQWPKLPQGRKSRSRKDRNYEDELKEIQFAQDEVLKEVYETAGLNAVLQLVTKVPQSSQLGLSLGRSLWIGDAKQELLKQHLASSEPAWENFAEGLLFAHTKTFSREQIEEIIRNEIQNLEPAQVARYLCIMPSDLRTWELVQQLGAEVIVAYWTWVLPYWIELPNAEQAARYFMHYNRFASVIELINHYTHDEGKIILPELLVEALEKLAEFGAETDRVGRVQGYTLEHLLDKLNDENTIDRSRLARLAFSYQPVFGFSHNPKIIEQELSTNPEFFVELLCLVYRDKSREELNPLKQGNLAFKTWERAWKILREWKTIPGSSPDGQIDEAVLLGWIESARSLAKKADRETSCDMVLGGLLSHAKQEVDKAPWPPIAVLGVIEKIHTKELLSALRTGRYNIHGRTHAVTGGTREQAIADDYTAWAKHYRGFPYTAKLLRGLADEFRRMAIVEQGEADLREQTER